jgi:hypothetical protein
MQEGIAAGAFACQLFELCARQLVMHTGTWTPKNTPAKECEQLDTLCRELQSQPLRAAAGVYALQWLAASIFLHQDLDSMGTASISWPAVVRQNWMLLCFLLLEDSAVGHTAASFDGKEWLQTLQQGAPHTLPCVPLSFSAMQLAEEPGLSWLLAPACCA